MGRFLFYQFRFVPTKKQLLGRFGEQQARNFLIRRGYKILNSNVKVSYGEIDIVANINNITVFVEVKTSACESMGPADDAITRKQINRLKKTISGYCQTQRLSKTNARLDFIAITLNKKKSTAKIRHYLDIF